MQLSSRIALVVLAAALLSPRPGRAAVTTAADICDAAQDPCEVKSALRVEPGSTLDFGTSALLVRQGGSLAIEGGTMTIFARTVMLEPGAALLANEGSLGGTIGVTAADWIRVEASGLTQARIDVSGMVQGGMVSLVAGGAVEIDGVVAAQGGSGGSVAVEQSHSVAVLGDILASGGDFGAGGDVSLIASADVLVGGRLDASGGEFDGGSIYLEAGGMLTTTASARLDVHATRGAAAGGDVDLVAGGAALLAGEIQGRGACTVGAGCFSSGGKLGIAAGGAVQLDALVDLSGARPDGIGGSVEIDTGSDLTQTGVLLASAEGRDGCGGDVSITGGRDVTLGPIDVSGGSCAGGTVSAQAGRTLSVPERVDASSRTLDGSGGDIKLSACALQVTGTLAAEGDAGTNLLQAGGQMLIEGTLTAGGTNQLEYLDETRPPDTGAASITPLPLLVQNPALLLCGGVPPESCGDRELAPEEECDDGNTDACDGCSPTCLREACGNGRAECSEQCDDGNTDACDGCSPTCRLEACGNGRVECGEQCDDGAANGTPGDLCGQQCQLLPPPHCGDPNQDPDEECDDGNLTDCDGCSHICRLERCGNGIVECDEQCDDFNQNACDGCSPTCHLEACGNGVVECQEECDDGVGNGNPGALCDENCKLLPMCSTEIGPPCVPCTSDTACDPEGACGQSLCLAGTCTPHAPPNCTDGDCDTRDACVVDGPGRAHCEHRPGACNDGNACNGEETCSAGVCIRGTAPVCDDGDLCTDDRCEPDRGCVSVARTGFASVTCALDTMDATLGSVASPVREKLAKLIARGRLTLAAAERAGHGRRALRPLRTTGKQLKVIARVVRAAQRRNKVSLEVADALLRAADGAGRVLLVLRDSLRS